MQLWDGKTYQTLLNLPNNNFPPETAGECELSTSWHMQPNVDIWSRIKTVSQQYIASDTISIYLRQRVSVTGDGEGYVKLKLYFEKANLVNDEVYGNLDCLATLKEQNTTPHFTSSCIKPFTTSANGCTATVWPICKDTFQMPHEFASLSQVWDPLCEELIVTATSNTNRQKSQNKLPSCAILQQYEYCIPTSDPTKFQCQPKSSCHHVTPEFTCTTQRNSEVLAKNATIIKEQVCAVSVDTKTHQLFDNCQQYRSDPNCQQQRIECLDEQECLNKVEFYRCANTTTIADKVVTTTMTCPDSLNCMGTTCANNVTTTTTGVTQAALYLQALQYMQDDINCIGTDGSQSVVCHVFAGEAQTCREGYFGKMECCTAPSSVNLNDYIRLTAYVMTLKTALSAVSTQTAAFGSWSNPQLLNAAQGMISSTFDSIVANVGSDTASMAAETFSQELTKKIADFVAQTMGEEMKNQLFTETAGAGGSTMVELNPQIMAAAQGVMMAYVAYQAAKLIIAIVTQCREPEIQTSIKLGLNSCLYQGSRCTKKVAGKCIVHEKSYCCYNSTLARIMMQEVQRLGYSADICKGIPLDEFAKMDLSQIDLSEWEYYLQSSGLMPNGELSLESLTGSGSVLDTNHNRQNSAKRTEQHLQQNYTK